MHAILYRSLARPGLLADDLNAIIATAQERNRQLGVTGLLLHGRLETIPSAPGEFVQWVEGPEEEVENLFALIETDERHRDVEVLGRGSIAELTDASHTSVQVDLAAGRLFPMWSMGLVRLAELPATLDGFLRFAADWDGHVLASAA